MNGTGLLTRILLALGLAMFCLIVTSAHATPVQPDIRQVLAQPDAPAHPFATARAGWNGPEMPPSPQAAPNLILETFGVTAQRREIERGLRAAAIPDPRAVAAILTAILVLRRVRRRPTQLRLATRPHEAEPMAA